jgi:hypothetical protein
MFGDTPTHRTDLKPIGPSAGVISSRLFKNTQQHTAGFTENNWTAHLLRPTLPTYTNTYMYSISVKNDRNIGSNWPFEMNSLPNQPHASF